jgi:glycosyltransferase involved in cell wall biosynthesis
VIVKRVVIGIPAWSPGPVCDFAENLVKALPKRGFDARILITEPPASRENFRSPRADLPLTALPHAPHDGPADLWLALIRHLEEQAPCIYLSNQDWTAAFATMRLSNRVQVVGVLHEDSLEEYESCARLGRFWNAIVAFEPGLRQRLIGEYPAHAARLYPVRHALRGPQSGDADGMSSDFAALFAITTERTLSGQYRRRQQEMSDVPRRLMPGLVGKEIESELKRVNSVPVWPDVTRRQKPVRRHGASSSSLGEHKIVIAIPAGRVSGVDVFSINLARALISRGLRAEIVQTMPDANIADRVPLPDDVPVFRLNTRPYPTWRETWAAMREHLEQRAPCIFVPNYDSRHSCVIPTLSSRVKAVGIGHSDDSQHYAHMVHLAPYWDAVVGVSDAITAFIAGLAPGIEDRQFTIPYGVPVGDTLPRRDESASGRLRVVYTGRIVRFQKRAMDLVSIADVLREKNSCAEVTVAGGGSDLADFISAAGPAILSGHLRYLGGLSNADVMSLLRESQVFVLPSAFEGLPVSLLEAMSTGCVPVVTAIRSGVPEVIRHGENGFLVPVGGIREFADCISALENDASLLARMRRNAHSTVRDRFGIDKMTAAYIDVFERIIANQYIRPRGHVLPPPGLDGIQSVIPNLPLPVRRLAWGLIARGR